MKMDENICPSLLYSLSALRVLHLYLFSFANGNHATL